MQRVAQVNKEIDQSGSYEMEEKELIFGARLAWRNSARCIGRIQWKKLQVIILVLPIVPYKYIILPYKYNILPYK